MELIRDFSKISKNNTALAGGKGASLGEMTQAGISVPPGFVILSGAFERFIEETNIRADIDAVLHSVDREKIHTVDEASDKIGAMILSAEMPEDIAEEIKKQFQKLGAKFVAVRSSATAEDSSTAAWAGQLETYLNTTKETLLENVKKCWASLFTPRAIFYRFEKDLHEHKISVAVVIQKMIESEVAGIAFSVHPVTQDENQLIIEAGFGLGEAVVSGQITPDSYVVEKKEWLLLDIQTSKQEKEMVRKPKGGNEWKKIPKSKQEKQKLSGKQIIELAKLVVKIEKHYGFPCDIEWALKDGKFYITQSRPITTLMPEPKKDDLYSKDKHKFVLSYTRDRQIITQHAWFYGNSKGMEKLLKPKLTFDVPVILYINNGSIELWEDKESIKELERKVAETHSTNPEFCKKIINFFNENLKSFFEPRWKNGFTKNKKELKEVAQKFVELSPYYIFMWYSTMIPEKISPSCKKEINAWRKTDAFFENTGKYIEKSLETIYPKLKLYRTMITIDEIDNPPGMDILRLRKKHYVSIPGFVNEIITLQEFAKKNKEYSFEIEEASNVNVLKGKVAFPGIVKGKVKLLRNRDQIKNVKTGEIIVSPMTIPEFLPAMKKAAAFVTDEGGLLCHAAIVSREMKKPCIIGTKIATKVFKDNDLVEVNADKGTVKILKKGK